MTFLNKCESFIIEDKDKGIIKDIITLYKHDNFNEERLMLHRDIVIHAMKTRLGYNLLSMNDVVCFLTISLDISNVIPEFFRFIRIILSIPVFNATCERPFSALWRFKTFIRNTL